MLHVFIKSDPKSYKNHDSTQTETHNKSRIRTSEDLQRVIQKYFGITVRKLTGLPVSRGGGGVDGGDDDTMILVQVCLCQAARCGVAPEFVRAHRCVCVGVCR